MPNEKDETRTTVMLRNLPREYNRTSLLQMLDSNGFKGKYNFVYMPIDFVRQASLGYAFINLATPNDVVSFWKAFDGFDSWVVQSPKVCRVSWSMPHQGYEAHVERYR